MQDRTCRRKISGPQARAWQLDFLLWPFLIQISKFKNSKFECSLHVCYERLLLNNRRIGCIRNGHRRKSNCHALACGPLIFLLHVLSCIKKDLFHMYIGILACNPSLHIQTLSKELVKLHLAPKLYMKPCVQT